MTDVHELTNSTMLGTIQFVNVMHLQCQVTSPTVAQVQAAVNAVASSFYNLMTSYSPSGARWQAGTKVTVFDDATPAIKSFVPTLPTLTSGTGTGASQPGQLAVCIDWLTGLPGRSHRGRTFYGPLNTAALGGPVLSPGALTAFNSAPNGLIAALTALTPSWRVGVYSKKLKFFFDAVSGYTDGVPDTLRSRKY